MSAEELMQILMITKMDLLKMLSEVSEVLLKLRNSKLHLRTQNEAVEKISQGIK